MTQENLLNQEDLPPTIDPNTDYLAELVGEGKKFKDQKDLAKGKFESDQYIHILERRLDDMRGDYLKMREENTTRARLEDLVDKITKERQASSDTTTANEDRTQPQYNPEEVASLVSNKIQEYESTKRQTENFDMVKTKLQQRYGSNYKEAVKQTIEELGITEQELNDMARKQPKVLIKTLGLDQEQRREGFQAPPHSEQRRDNFAPSSTPKRTWSYYQNLKKQNPDLYLDRKTAIQMQQDAIDLGETFRDGDYFVKGLHE